MMKKTNNKTTFAPAMFAYILTANDGTLRYIAQKDYGMEEERHFDTLKHIITKQNGYITNEQAFYPAEVVELAAYDATHAHAYTICHLMMIQSHLAHSCYFILSAYYQHYQDVRQNLPQSMITELDHAYQCANDKGEIDPNW